MGGLSRACAQVEPASSKNIEMLEINVLQNLTPHALLREVVGDFNLTMAQKVFIEFFGKLP